MTTPAITKNLFKLKKVIKETEDKPIKDEDLNRLLNIDNVIEGIPNATELGGLNGQGQIRRGN